MPAAGAANRQATPAPSASRSRCTGPVGTAWNPGSSAGGFNWWLQRFPDAEVVVGAVLRGRPEMPRVVRERFWDLVRSGVAPGDAGVAAGSADGARRWFRGAGRGGGGGGGWGGGGGRGGWGGALVPGGGRGEGERAGGGVGAVPVAGG